MTTRIPHVADLAIADMEIAHASGPLVAHDITVRVSFRYSPGAPAVTYGPQEWYSEALPAEFTFDSVRAIGNVWFFNGTDDFPIVKYADGDELLPALTEAHLEMLEEKLLDSVVQQESD